MLISENLCNPVDFFKDSKVNAAALLIAHSSFVMVYCPLEKEPLETKDGDTVRVLIVDDERNIRLSIKKYLGLENIDAQDAESGETARAYLEKERFDAIILDLKLPGMSGQNVLEWIRQRGIAAPVIMISAHGQIPDAVNALKAGAQDYLVKPFDPVDLITKLRSLGALGSTETKQQTGRLIGSTELMRRISDRIDRIAGADVTVLLTGESGTGKEVVAREIHARSPACEKPFVAVNIGGIHESLMESELFGHEKGSFTGAVARKQGLFELAGEGTLFLDEIGEMPMPLQVKLLRVLQERKFRRIGGLIDIPVKARIISATNCELEAMVKESRFREDLYYRLNVFRIELPPLRARREDIPLLSEHLLEGRRGRLSPEAVDKLLTYSFPGNIRELENILERALVLVDGPVIGPGDIDLPDLDGKPAETGLTMENVEREAIREALMRCQGNRTKAAEMLGISRKTILNKIKAYNLGSDD
jgi:two-component system response regulator AtoC